MGTASATYRIENIELDLAMLRLTVDGAIRELEPKAFRLLRFLVENRDRVLTKEEILTSVWQDTVVSDNALARVVAQIRKALDDDPKVLRFIETVPTIGYRFIANVAVIANEPAVEARSVLPQRAVERDGREPGLISTSSRSVWIVPAAAVFFLATAVGAVVLLREPARAPVSYPLPLTTLPGRTQYPSFSPDGEMVAFSWSGLPRHDNQQHLNIYVKSVKGGDPVAITTGATWDQYPQWSPDSTRIAFVRSSETGFDLVVAPATGGPEQRITAIEAGLAWSPDSKEIAYIKPGGKAGGIAIRTLATGRDRDLISLPEGRENQIAWSRDGATIAFGRALSDADTEIFLIPSSGGVPRQLTSDNRFMEGFAWTADSRELVFAAVRQGGPSLWRIPAGGGNPEQIPSTAHHASFPAISARGNRLAFAEAYNDSNVWRYELASGSETNAAAAKCLICSTVEDDTPRFSPDGRKIAFVSRRTGSDEVWVASSDGSHATQLTTIGGFGTGSPRWSRDGRWIAFDSRMRGNADIFVIGADGGVPRQITTETSKDTMPGWSHDGRWVYFTSDRGGSYHVWKAPFEGGAAVQVTQGFGGEAIEDPDGKYVYYFNDGQSVWRVPTNGGREEVVPELAGVERTRNWTVRERGIYFSRVGPDGNNQIRFFAFGSRRVETVASLTAKPAFHPSVDVSPDGRTLLYAQTDNSIGGLLMINNFR